MLRQALKQGESRLALQPLRSIAGTLMAIGMLFSLPFGNASRGTLVVGNVSGSDIGVDVYPGQLGPPNGGTPTNPRVKNNGFWIVELDPAIHANSHVIVQGTGDMVVQFAVNGVMDMTGVPTH